MAFGPFSQMEHRAFYLVTNGKETAGLLNADKLFLVRKERLTPAGLLKSFLSSPAAFSFSLFVFFNLLFLTVVLRRQSAFSQPSAEIREWEETAQEIIHRIRNLMFTIQLEAENAAKIGKIGSVEDGQSPAIPSWQSILEDVKSASQLVRAFSKILVGRSLKLEKVDLNQLVLGLVQRLAEPLKGRVEFITELDKDGVSMWLDKEKIEEALTNIILNSIEALPDKGWVRVSTSVSYSPFFRSRRGVRIEIEDNGVGIPADKIDEIFKPSFSTKKEGLGIGLTISKRIINAHGGKIYVHSREKVGTRFAVFLPWQEQQSQRG